MNRQINFLKKTARNVASKTNTKYILRQSINKIFPCCLLFHKQTCEKFFFFSSSLCLFSICICFSKLIKCRDHRGISNLHFYCFTKINFKLFFIAKSMVEGESFQKNLFLFVNYLLGTVFVKLLRFLFS